MQAETSRKQRIIHPKDSKAMNKMSKCDKNLPEEYFKGIKEIGVYRADTATVNTNSPKDVVEKVVFKKQRH